MIYVYTINSIGLNNIVFFSSTHSAYNYAVKHNIRMADGKIKVIHCTINTAIGVLEDVILRKKARKAIEEAKRNTSTEMTENV